MIEPKDIRNDLVKKGGPFLRRAFEEFMLALSLLTRISLPRFEVTTEATIASAFWAYPIAGAVVGLVGAGAFVLGAYIGFGAVVNCLLAIAAMTFFSGALHEDGLADFFDSFGGTSQNERLQIMRDSRIGTYGVLSLVFFVGLCAGLLHEIASKGGTGNVAASLIASAACARAAVGIPLLLLNPARAEGMSVAAQKPQHVAAIVAGAVLIVLAVFLLGLSNAAYLVLGAVLCAISITGLAYQLVGGHTGDVLGATASTAMFGGLAGLAMAGGA